MIADSSLREEKGLEKAVAYKASWSQLNVSAAWLFIVMVPAGLILE